MSYDTNIISIQSTTDASNSNFDKKLELLSHSMYQYLEHSEKKYGWLYEHNEKLSGSAFSGNYCIAYSALWNQEINTNVAGIMCRAVQDNTMRVVSNINVTDIKNIIIGVNLAFDHASIQIEKEQTDIDALLYCLLKNLQTELDGIYSLIKRVFVNIVHISIKLYEDPEINDYKKVIFEVSVNDTVTNILNMEDKFYANLYNIGEKHNIEYFVLKCKKYVA